MTTQKRYAIYFVPEQDSRLARLANSLLGRDSETDSALLQPKLSGCTPHRLREITDEPAKYGLHATLKAPFHLAEGYTEADVLNCAETLAARLLAFSVPGLRLKSITSFLALVPKDKSGEEKKSVARLRALAADCLEHFDHMRRPASEEEIKRRMSTSLNAQQVAYLQRWGYPYVLDDYRFHLTLTGRLRNSGETARLKKIFSDFLQDTLNDPVRVDSFCICYQNINTENNAPQAGHFRLLRRFYFPQAATDCPHDSASPFAGSILNREQIAVPTGEV